MEKATKSYSQGKMLLSVYANSNSIGALSKGFDLLKASYLTALNTAAMAPIVDDSTDYSGYINFLVNTLSIKSKDGFSERFLTDSQLVMNNNSTITMSSENNEDARIIDGSDTLRHDFITRMQRFTGMQRTPNTSIALGSGTQGEKEWSVTVGNMAHALGKSSVAIGGEYNKKSKYGDNNYTTAKSDYSIAVGAVSKALGYGSIALGCICIFSRSYFIGSYSNVTVDGVLLSGTTLYLVGLLAFLGICLFCKDRLKTPNLNRKVRKVK